MKKILFVALISSLIGHSAFAIQKPIIKRASFAPQTWVSKGPADAIEITLGDQNSPAFSVQIYVNQPLMGMDGKPLETTGVNVKNCGSVTHINPGSSAICPLTWNNNTVTFSADRNISSSGSYQVSSNAK